jgi:Lon protease-like protein
MAFPPSTIPVILLAECNVFPHALLPLNIFEPRYRAMLARALESDRLMAVATLRLADEDAWDEADETIEPFSCIGLLRACVGQPDGSSRLILQGMSRIRFTGWVQREPFRIARCEPVPTEVGDPVVADRLAHQALARARATLPPQSAMVAQFDKQFGPLEDPEIIADVIGYNFLTRASERQPLLGMTRVEDRLEYLLARLVPVAPASD